MNRILIVIGSLVVIGATAGAALYLAYPMRVTHIGGLARIYLMTLSMPPGETSTEANADYDVAAATPPSPAAAAPLPATASEDWPSYNRTLASERFSPLSQIDTGNAADLKVICTYDTGQYSSFESGLIMVEGALIGTTHLDIFSLDPATCKENWRVHEDDPWTLIPVNRGAAYMDGRLFRGTQDGRVVAYDFKTGKKLWETTIADPKRGESAPSAPIAWDGLVYIGNAGGDYKGGKGRMYALEATTGEIVWEFFLVPKGEDDTARGPQGASPLDDATWGNLPGIPISGGGTWTSYTLDTATGHLYVPGGNPAPDFALGAREGENLYSGSVVVLDAKTGDYRNHFKIVPKDWHDWDVSNPPILSQTAGGRQLLSVAPKDGHLYGFDLATNDLLYRVPVTRVENADVPFSTEEAVHFCPGPVGGAEWNSPAYDPTTNLILIGEVEWCFTVTVDDDDTLRTVPVGQPWAGMSTWDPLDVFGIPASASDGDWAGWVYAVDADTGIWKWRLKSNFPILSGLTPTAGGVVFFGDTGGDFHVLDAANGEPLWRENLGGAIGGGVITYTVEGAQKVAVAAGFTSIIWPTKVVTGKIVILGLDDGSASQ